MKRNMGMRPFDLILISSLLIGALGLWIYDSTGTESSSIVRIYNEQGLFREVPLNDEARIAIQGPLGESIIVVHSGEVSMADSPCANKLCIRTGKIGRHGGCILCLPNRVSVVVSSRSTDMDALSY